MKISIYKEYTVIGSVNHQLSRFNMLKKQSSKAYAVVSMDSLYTDTSAETIIFLAKNYIELIQEEIDCSFLEWHSSEEDAIRSFLQGFD